VCDGSTDRAAVADREVTDERSGFGQQTNVRPDVS
jgi:hypothetical protein